MNECMHSIYNDFKYISLDETGRKATIENHFTPFDGKQ